MRKTISLLAFLMFTGFAAGVVGADCPPGQPCIMGGSSPNNGSANYEPVERNGSDWEATLKVHSTTPDANISEELVNASYSSVNGSKTMNFTGVIKAPNPSYRPQFNVTETSDGYNVDIQAVETKGNDTVTTQVITRIEYTLEFTSEQAFQLQVNQGNVSETFEHPDSNENSSSEEESTQEPENQDEGLFTGFFTWFGSLF